MMLKRLTEKRGFRLFLILYGLFFVVGAGVLVLTKRGDVVLLVNRYSRIEWDSTVEFLTNIGLGGYMAIAACLLFFYKVRHAATGLLNLLIIGIFTNVLKEFLKGVFTRPLHYFLYDDFSRFIYTADINYYSSFPSGHSMTIFGMFAFFAFLANRKTISVILFFLAVTVGFSRIYLLQHFFVDVYAGAFFGICSLLITIWLTETRFHFLKKEIFDRSLQQNIRLLLQRKKVVTGP
ncbi:MAG: phosphatase PAP2 family protein [Prolixibacteraceae bacterium]|jgi:membrane-associated phospholipid phosphatase|nr:phosphatase PAP2 family protein [Prolixibacteraceae bacterium]